MKKHLLIATGLAVLSTSAFATKARLDALGQSNNGNAGVDYQRGSFYIEDTRNVFRNAAKVNSMKNYIVTEWGTANNDGSDAVNAPSAEGGFFREAGAFSYGLYMGANVDDGNADRDDVDTAFQDHDNGLDLFIGGDAGVEWGARLHYAAGETSPTGGIETKHSAFGLGLGIVMGDLEAWTNLALSDKSEGASAANDMWEADLGLNLGVSYGFGDQRAWLEYDKTGFEDTTGSTKNAAKERTQITLGYGKTHEVSASSRWFMDAQLVMWSEDDTVSNLEDKRTTLPLTVGFEADATSWLTLRGSISQIVLINKDEDQTGANATTESVVANSTNVQAGATLNFGKLKVDGVIGTDDGAATESGALRLDQLMSRVAVHYWF